MPKLRRLWMRLRATLGLEHSDRDFGDELESILQMHVDDNLRRGMTPGEARRQAHITLAVSSRSSKSRATAEDCHGWRYLGVICDMRHVPCCGRRDSPRWQC